MPDFGKVFPGATPTDHRRFIAPALAHLRERGFDRVIVPACGDFSLVKCAVAAGFAKDRILATDICLFSSLLGYYYMGRPLAELPFTIKPGALLEEYRTCETDVDRLAVLLFHMKLSQLRIERDFERRYATDLREHRPDHLARMKAGLESFREFYSGISYLIEHPFGVLARGGSDAVVLLNPVVSAARMFKGMGGLDFKVDAPEWNKKDAPTLYAGLKTHGAASFLFSVDSHLDPDGIVYASESGPKRFDYWLCTHPEVLSDFPQLRALKLKPKKPAAPYQHIPIFSDSDQLTAESIVTFVKVQEEQALYYRDLLAHRLGDTAAEIYLLCLIDGKMFSVCGFHAQKLRIGQEHYLAETFGFTVRLHDRPDINRLLMLFITCEEFARFMADAMSRVNRTYDMRGLKTTCLSKYRKVKLNNGVLPVVSREKLAKGPFADMYRIVYQVDWYKRSYKECIALYLAEGGKK
jgi:hypothetical protein